MKVIAASLSSVLTDQYQIRKKTSFQVMCAMPRSMGQAEELVYRNSDARVKRERWAQREMDPA